MSSTGAGAAAGTLPDALLHVDGLLAGLTRDARGQGGDLTHTDLTDTLVLLGQVQARCDALLLATVGEVDARGTFTLDGALTTAAWLRATIRATPGTARRAACDSHATYITLAPTGKSSKPAPSDGSSPPPNAEPSSPETATAAPPRTATAPAPGQTPTT